MEQGSQEWVEARLGLVTASRIADVMAMTKSGYSASRKNYMAQLVVERLTGQPQDTYTNAAMQWGVETEPYAREAYEIMTGEIVEECGFVEHDTLATGASPDGLVGTDGLVEIKCPNTSTHIETLLAGKVDRKYVLQMQWQMYIAERQWCDFVSYDPRLSDGLKYFCRRVEKDVELLSEIFDEVCKFLEELDEMCAKLQKVAA